LLFDYPLSKRCAGKSVFVHVEKENLMRKFISWGPALFVAIIGIAASQDAQPPGHVMTTPSEIKWGDPPKVFEKGATFAVVSGDPSKTGIYVVRLKMPAGYKIAPHWHPTDEHVTVISGQFALGMGDKIDEATAKALPPGSYALLPAKMHHYAVAKSEAVVQVHGMGPFALTYVNPADDPSKRVSSE
jgi:quercetin dioxygenase-like cupin family protein